MTQSSKYEITTKEFFSVFDDKAYIKKYSNVTKVIDKLKNNIFNHSDEDINLDYYDIQSCFSETQQGIIQVVKSDNIFMGLIKIINDSIIETKVENLIHNVIIHFALHTSIDMMDISNAMELIHETAHEDSQVCWCVRYDESYSSDQIEINSLIFYSTNYRC